MGDINQNKICAIIVTYNPDYGLINLINTIKNQVERIIIIDNNSDEFTLPKILENICDSNILQFKNKENYGIGKALNQGVEIAIKLGFEWVITFDQDTIPFNNIIDIISEVYYSYPDRNNIGAIGTNYIYKDLKKKYQSSNVKLYEKKDVLITSGCFVPVRIFLEIEGFREDMFIDHIDEEFCLRLKKHGKISLISSKLGMVHEAGNIKKISILGLPFSSSNHSTLRRFYMSRNHVLLTKEYIFINPIFIVKSSVSFFIELLQMLIVDDNKIRKLIATIKGLYLGIIYASNKKKYYDFK